MSIHQLKKFQLGKETVRGTAVAATKMLAGSLDVSLENEWHAPEDTLGVLSKAQRRELIFKQVGLKYSGPAYYEQLLWFLGMTVKGGITGVQQAATAAYLWTFQPLFTATNVPDTYTIEYGDDTQNWETEYCFCRNLKISGTGKAPMQLEADIVGRQLTESTVTAALTLVTGLESPIFTKTAFTIDTTWAGLGGTAKAATLIGYEINIPGFVPLPIADNFDYFSKYGDQGRKCTGKLTMLYNAIGDVEHDSYRAGTARFIRLKTLGTQIETTYYKWLLIDMAIKYTNVKLLGEWEGQTIGEFEFETVYDVTGTNEFLVSVQNALTTIP